MTTEAQINYEKLVLLFCLFCGVVLMQERETATPTNADHDNGKGQYRIAHSEAGHLTGVSERQRKPFGQVLRAYQSPDHQDQQTGRRERIAQTGGRQDRGHGQYGAVREDNSIAGQAFGSVPDHPDPYERGDGSYRNQDARLGEDTRRSWLIRHFSGIRRAVYVHPKYAKTNP